MTFPIFFAFVRYDFSMLAQYTSELVTRHIDYTPSRVLQACKKLNLPCVEKQCVLGEEEIVIVKKHWEKANRDA